MRKNSQNGFSLIELLVALVVSAIAISMIAGTFTFLIRYWNHYSTRMDVTSDVWQNYLKVQNIFSKTSEIRGTSDKEWILLKDNVKKGELLFRDKELSYKDSVERWKVEVDSFSLEIVDTSGTIPVWQCALTCSKRKEKASMVWRTVCNSEWSDTLLPKGASSIKQ